MTPVLSHSFQLFLPLFTIMTIASSLSEAPVHLHPSKIGTMGKPWGPEEFTLWRDTRVKSRCYFTDIVPAVKALSSDFDVEQYGEIPNPNDPLKPFPLFALKTKDWSSCEDSNDSTSAKKQKPSVLITGGIHGYETSGVQGALLFASSKAQEYSSDFNIMILPCVSPWAYERIQRWNAHGVDPNRSFNPHGDIVPGRSFNPEPATEESAAVMALLQSMEQTTTSTTTTNKKTQWICHLDLHETTDTDETEFRPAKNARDGLPPNQDKGEIPDGFYLVQDETSPQPQWFTAMIESVRKVTHIAPADSNGKLIGECVSQEGVIQIPCKKSLGLCAGVTNAPYRTTTEVYPDSANATPEQCNLAQVACIQGALDYIRSIH